MTEEDSPLKVAGRPTAEPVRTEEHGVMVWELALPYKAIRTGEQIFPAPIINERRISKLDASGNPTWVRTLAQGNTLSVKVVPPPEEGDPSALRELSATPSRRKPRSTRITSTLATP